MLRQEPRATNNRKNHRTYGSPVINQSGSRPNGNVAEVSFALVPSAVARAMPS